MYGFYRNKREYKLTIISNRSLDQVLSKGDKKFSWCVTKKHIYSSDYGRFKNERKHTLDKGVWNGTFENPIK